MKQYSKRSALMHWLIFVLVVAAFILGHNVGEMQDATQKLAMYPYHFILGNMVMVLVLVRIFFRKKDGEPAPANSNPLLNKVASLTHVLLNLSLIAVPVSGFASVATSGLLNAFMTNDPNLVPNFHEVAAKQFHEMFIGVLVLLLVIHVAATLYHQFILKDNLLRRIMIKRVE